MHDLARFSLLNLILRFVFRIFFWPLITTSLSFVIWWMAVSFYQLFLHPLSGVPGPKLAAISNVWYANQARHGRCRELGKTLHERYGPVVRVGPNEVWFNTKEAFKMIYASGGYEKSDFYPTTLHRPRVNWRLQVQSPDTLDLLSERDMKRYRLQRRLIGTTYHISNLKKHEHAIDAVLKKAVAQLRNLNGAEIDLKQWMHIIVVECLGAVVLSWSPGYIKDKSDGGTGMHAYRGWRRKSVYGLFPWAPIMATYSKMLGRAFSKFWGLTYSTPKGFKTFFTSVYHKSSRRINTAIKGTSPGTQRQDLLADLIKLNKSKPAFTETYLRRMTMTNFGAGHETMTSALTSTMAMIGSHGQVQKKAVEEVQNADDPVKFDDSVRLAYTQASIKEALRLHPVIGMSLPRKVPSGGMHIHGHYIPAGTTVGCNPVALHRNEDIFGPDAAAFNPDRWLNLKLDTKAMERFNLTWGGGARTCPGRHLGELIVYKVVPTLLKEFEVEVDIPPEEDMPIYFMAMLSGVKARFLPRKQLGGISSP